MWVDGLNLYWTTSVDAGKIDYGANDLPNCRIALNNTLGHGLHLYEFVYNTV